MFKSGVTRTAGNSSVILVAILMMAVSVTYAADSPKAAKSSAARHETTMSVGEWKKIVEAAKKEGKLVMAGDASEEYRKALVDLFKEDYPEIKVEYTGGPGRDFTPRIQKEREMGQYLWDVRSGGTTGAFDMKNEGFLDPIRPLLLPEIADNAKWVGGLDGLFADKEHKFVATYLMTTDSTAVVNRDFITEAELRSSGQLLDPKFKGKIVLETPVKGASFNAMANFAFMYGENFVSDLLTKQEVVITDDKRQQTEWVIRGRYPIAIGFNDNMLIPFVKQGLGKNVLKLADKAIPVSAGIGALHLFKDAPHPNAARVYINWLLSKNAQMKITKILLFNSVRTDVPPVVKELSVDPKHLSSYRFYYTEENVENSKRLVPLINKLIKK